MMKIALLTAHLSNRAGGFAQSIPGIARALSMVEGCDVHILGVRDRRSPEAWREWGLRVHPHEEFGSPRFHFSPAVGTTLERLSAHVVDSQGIWMHQSLVNLRWHRRSGRPYVITPRGMLDPWALNRANWKKQLVRWWFEGEHLARAACLHALNTTEAAAIRAFGLKNPIAIVPNGVDLPVLAANLEGASAERRRLLFLGRIHPKKGLEELLHGWASPIAAPVRSAWDLDIVGWDDGGHLPALRTLANGLGIATSVRFSGPAFGSAKQAAFRAADAFVLPSFSEGLPVAVLEAWSYALPALITPACNLPEGFAAEAAIRIEPSAESIAHGLTVLDSMTDLDRAAMGLRGRRLVERRFQWSAIAGEMKAVYAWALGGGERPACVVLD